MNKRWAGILFFALVALLQLGDFLTNLITLLDGDLRMTTASRLRLSPEQEMLRVIVLLVATFAMFLVYALVAYGFYSNTIWRTRYLYAVLAGAIYAGVHMISYYTLPVSPGSWIVSMIYVGIIVATFFVGRWASRYKVVE